MGGVTHKQVLKIPHMESRLRAEATISRYESSTERMVIRQRIHPDAARALREFAAQVIEHDAGTIVH